MGILKKRRRKNIMEEEPISLGSCHAHVAMSHKKRGGCNFERGSATEASIAMHVESSRLVHGIKANAALYDMNVRPTALTP